MVIGHRPWSATTVHYRFHTFCRLGAQSGCTARGHGRLCDSAIQDAYAATSGLCGLIAADERDYRIQYADMASRLAMTTWTTFAVAPAVPVDNDWGDIQYLL